MSTSGRTAERSKGVAPRERAAERGAVDGVYAGLPCALLACGGGGACALAEGGECLVDGALQATEGEGGEAAGGGLGDGGLNVAACLSEQAADLGVGVALDAAERSRFRRRSQSRSVATAGEGGGDDGGERGPPPSRPPPCQGGGGRTGRPRRSAARGAWAERAADAPLAGAPGAAAAHPPSTPSGGSIMSVQSGQPRSCIQASKQVSHSE